MILRCWMLSWSHFPWCCVFNQVLLGCASEVEIIRSVSQGPRIVWMFLTNTHPWGICYWLSIIQPNITSCLVFDIHISSFLRPPYTMLVATDLTYLIGMSAWFNPRKANSLSYLKYNFRWIQVKQLNLRFKWQCHEIPISNFISFSVERYMNVLSHPRAHWNPWAFGYLRIPHES